MFKPGDKVKFGSTDVTYTVQLVSDDGKSLTLNDIQGIYMAIHFILVEDEPTVKPRRKLLI